MIGERLREQALNVAAARLVKITQRGQTDRSEGATFGNFCGGGPLNGSGTPGGCL
jgi:hypothetical protein